jgi:hypothetical protein
MNFASKPMFRFPSASPIQPKVMGLSLPRYYANLNPSANVPVNREEIFTLRSFYEQYRLESPGQHGQRVPNWKYIFIRTLSGEILAHPRFRHPVLAEGKPVLYAGELFFNNGRLEWWSNGSGNYRPDKEHAEQANLSLDSFRSYEDILKGVTKAKS